MIKKILVATDGSPHGGRAMALAAELSSKLGADLTIVHVLMHGRPPPEFQRLAEVEHMIAHTAPQPAGDVRRLPSSMLDVLRSADTEARTAQVVAAIGDKIIRDANTMAVALGAQNVTTRICVGDFADEILEMADFEKADMIVVGNRGLGRLRGAILGSVSHKVAQHAECSVTIVK